MTAAKKKVEQVDQGLIVGQAALAKEYKVSTKTVKEWIAQGMPTVRRGGKGKAWHFERGPVDRWLVGRQALSSQQSKGAQVVIGSGSSGSMNQKGKDDQILSAEVSRKRKQHFEAQLVELEHKEKLGELVPAHEVDEIVGRFQSAVKAAIEGLPDEVVAAMGGEGPIDLVREAAQECVDRALLAMVPPDELAA